MKMNILGRSSQKQVLGVLVDGRDLRLAHLSKEGGEIVILALESITLPHRIGKLRQRHPAAMPMGQDAESRDAFGFDDTSYTMDNNATEESEGDISGALINIFAKYPLKQLKIAVNIPEGQTTFYSFENDFGLKGKKLLKRLREEIGPLAGGTLDSALLDYFISPDGGLTAIVSEGNIPIIEELLDVKNFLPGSGPVFGLAGSNEIALVNLVRANLDLPSDRISTIVYIGCDFSRVIILRGNDPISFVQTIREGYQSPHVCQTIFSKILLEQEEAGLPEIHNVILCGEIGITHAYDFFKRQFPDSDVQTITSGILNTQYLKSEEISTFPNFAIPVALAWEALEIKNDQFIRANLLPTQIKESQKLFKIAWHGFALLGIIFVFVALLSYQGLSRLKEIRTLERTLKVEKERIESLQPELALVNQLQGTISDYRANLDFLDSLIVDPGKWSRLLAKLSRDFQEVSRIWIDNIKSDNNGFTMIGKSAARDRIPDLAQRFQDANLKRVTRVVSEEGEISYEFEMTAALPPPEDEDAATAPVPNPGKDRANSAGGSIDAVESAQPAPAKANEQGEAMQANGAAQPAGSPPPLSAEDPPASGSRARYQQGIDLIRAKKIENAVQVLEALIADYPQSVEVCAAYYWLGECYYSRGEYSKAAERFEKSLQYEKNTKREAGLIMLGKTYLKMNQKEQAKVQFETLLESYPNGQFSDIARNYLQSLSHEG
jgi:tol-pal system protein YbgF